MELTKTEIMAIINFNEPAEHSPVAAQFIAEAKRLYGVDIVACYMDIKQVLKFKNEIPDPKNAYLVNYLRLTVYPRGIGGDVDGFKAKYSEKVLTLFKNIVSQNGEKLEYVRSITPVEGEHYGWMGKKREEWDRSKIIYPTGEIEEKAELHVDSFDSLAMWHLLSRKMKSINALGALENISAKAYYGWNRSVNASTLYIIVPEGQFSKLNDSKKTAVTSEILEYLHSVDKLGVVHDDIFVPIYTRWDDLSPEMQFSLLRG